MREFVVNVVCAILVIGGFVILVTPFVMALRNNNNGLTRVVRESVQPQKYTVEDIKCDFENEVVSYMFKEPIGQLESMVLRTSVVKSCGKVQFVYRATGITKNGDIVEIYMHSPKEETNVVGGKWRPSSDCKIFSMNVLSKKGITLHE